MKTTLSTGGQITLPRSVQRQAGVRDGDAFNIALDHGIIVLRKIQPMKEKEIKTLAEQSRRLPPLTSETENQIETAIQRVRDRRRK